MNTEGAGGNAVDGTGRQEKQTGRGQSQNGRRGGNGATSGGLDVISVGGRLPNSLRGHEPVFWDTDRGIFVDRGAGLTPTHIQEAQTAPLRLSLQTGTGFVSLQVNYGQSWAESTVVARPRKGATPQRSLATADDVENLFLLVLAEPRTHRVRLMRAVGLDLVFARGVRDALDRIAREAARLSQQRLDASLAAYLRRYPNPKRAASEAPLHFSTTVG